MRCLALLALVALATAIPQFPRQKAADKDLLQKQQDVILLLQQITHEIPDQQLRELGRNYDILVNIQAYENPAIVKYLVRLVNLKSSWRHNDVYYGTTQIRKHTALLTKILLGAHDYSTFLKTAAWAREHMNYVVFLKAFTIAVLQRQDTQGIILPAPYEIHPQYYLDSRIIQEAQNIRLRGVENPIANQVVVIPVNYTAWLPGGEDKLAYFTQDVGLASYYAYVGLAGSIYSEIEQVHKPYVTEDQSLMGQQHGKIGRGSRYYYLHQQLLSRYHLHRLSNDLGPIESIEYTKINAPFAPHTRYGSGLEFPARPAEVPLVDVKDELANHVWTLEVRLREAIDAGQVITPQGAFLALYQPQGLDILGDLIEGTGRSVNPRYYGSLQAAARELLGNSYTGFDHVSPYQQTPAVIEIDATAVRDPAFYQLYKKIIVLFHEYQNSLPAYQPEDILLPGVSIESVNVGQLMTYFDDFIVDLQSATPLPYNQQQRDSLDIKARLQRLANKPYEYHVKVQSDRPVNNAVVRVYIGPKYDHDGSLVHISENRLLFVELDQFVYDLQQGVNDIVRNSQEAPEFSIDHPSISHLWRLINDAVSSKSPFFVNDAAQIYGFPQRLALPKGTPGGYPLQFVVVISGPDTVQSVAYGPVIPEYEQSYQQPYYQIVEGIEYQQLVGQQIPKVGGIQQRVDVVHSGVTHQAEERESRFQRFWEQNPLMREGVQGGGYEWEVSPVAQQQGWSQQYGSGGVYGGKYQSLYSGQQGQIQQQEQQEVPQVVQQQGSSAVPTLIRQQGPQQVQSSQHLAQYFQNKHIGEVIGGAISLDGRPLGYPLERPLALGALFVPNVKIVDVLVYHQGTQVSGQENYHHSGF